MHITLNFVSTSIQTRRMAGLSFLLRAYGIDDLPLILQDRQFDGGALVLPQGVMVAMHGRRGDTLMVNGTINPVARVPRRLVRLCLVNDSNARIFDLAFADDRLFHWIASEGGLLESPAELRSLRLAPSERSEILVDFSDGRSTSLAANRYLVGALDTSS